MVRPGGTKQIPPGVFMNRVKLAMLAGTSLCLSVGASHAADMPLKAPIAPVVDPWVGFYAGGNLGYSWGKTNISTSTNSFNQEGEFDFFFPGGSTSTSPNVNGVIGGGQIGLVGRVSRNWLVGVEADIQWSGEKGSALGGFRGNTTECTTGNCSFTGAHDVTAQLSWFGTLRFRGGIEWNDLWFYGTAGLAYGEVGISGNSIVALLDNVSHSNVGNYSTAFSSSQFQVGWAAGLGIEGRIGNGPWRWKAEYLHIDLGSTDGGLFGGGLSTVTIYGSRFTDEILRVGFNYKFNCDNILVAKY